jgi:hypothetical protein
VVFSKELQCFYTHLKGAVWHQVDVPQPWKHWEFSSIPWNSKLNTNCKRRC